VKSLSCAICGKNQKKVLLYKETIAFDKIDKDIFSARRTPDRIHYQLLKCQVCGLIFSSPILAEDKIKHLYKKSELTYEVEIPSLKKTYGNYLRRALKFTVKKPKLVEIGGGNGFFLEEAKKNKVFDIWGVEPSREAVTKARRDIKKRIIIDFFPTKKIRPGSCDIICFFQTLDHVTDPNNFLSACHQALRREGIILCIQHDTEGLSVKLLGERSPIFDIEHIYLFNKSNLEKILNKNGFEILEVFNVENKFPLRYWLRMFPLPNGVKALLLKLTGLLKLADLPLKLPAGNMGAIARKI